jgi:hypothetical protein
MRNDTLASGVRHVAGCSPSSINLKVNSSNRPSGRVLIFALARLAGLDL